MGYTSGDNTKKLNSLMDESQGCAVLDTGCSTTVCGIGWLENYASSISDFERAQISEEESSSTFIFGDGVTVSSLKRVLLPCYIGDLRSEVSSDVVSCNIPLLLSKKSKKKKQKSDSTSAMILHR